jgi:hypothetical protein
MHTSPYLSPAGLLVPPEATGPNSLEKFPPTYIIYGGAERLARSIEVFWSRLRLARKVEAVMGRREIIGDRIVECPNAVHDFLIFPWMAEEAGETYQGLDLWLRELLAGNIDEDEEEAPGPQEEMGCPDWKDIALKRKAGRRMSRASLRIEKSPVMGPVKGQRGLVRMMGDMRSEGMRSVQSLEFLTSSSSPLLPHSVILSSCPLPSPPPIQDPALSQESLCPDPSMPFARSRLKHLNPRGIAS